MIHEHQSEINCRFSLSKNVLLEIKPYLEVSCACINCKRNGRTVVFRNIGARGICTPKGKCIGFPGVLNSLQLSNEIATFKMSFNYNEFVDKKYGESSNALPSWARVHYVLTCPKCMGQTEESTQTNIVRPAKQVCNCGYVLNLENENPISFELI